jgi:hypothetical protein
VRNYYHEVTKNATKDKITFALFVVITKNTGHREPSVLRGALGVIVVSISWYCAHPA